MAVHLKINGDVAALQNRIVDIDLDFKGAGREQFTFVTDALCVKTRSYRNDQIGDLDTEIAGRFPSARNAPRSTGRHMRSHPWRVA